MNSKFKYFFILLTFAVSALNDVYAYDATVIVLEAPLLKQPSLNSAVVQTIRKGGRVYVPNEVVVNGLLPEFVPTFDRTGNRAYISGRFIKVILGTTDESRTPVTLAGHDPTDYRLEEPISRAYPYEEAAYLRASVSFAVSNNTQSPYEYNSAFNKQSYPSELGMRITVSRKVAHDKYDRFYFGAIGFITNSNNRITFKNNFLADESRGLIRVGPWISYDSFKNDQYRLTVGTGFTFNYHRTTLFVDSGDTNEERIFSGYSLSPMISTNFQISDVLPYTDFVTGLDLSLFLPHSQKDTTEVEIPELWGGGSQIDSGLKPQASLFVGFQVKY